MPEYKPSMRALKRWVEKELSDEVEGIFDFKQFSVYKEIKDMDLVDQRALWNKLGQNFFKIMLTIGEFNLKEVGIVRLIYRFSEEDEKLSLGICPIINDSSCKPHLSKYTPIMKIVDEEALENELL